MWRCHFDCGGNGDRLKGIASTFIRAAAIGFDFRLDFPIWDVPGKTIFVPRDLVPWAWPLPAISGQRLEVAAIDRDVLDFCNWTAYEEVFVTTNLAGQRIKNETCASSYPFASEALMRTRNPWIEGHDEYYDQYALVGCTFWYLFAFGDELEVSLSSELSRLDAWKREHSRRQHPTVAVHIRAGDHAMRVGNLVYDSAGESGAETIMGCALRWSQAVGFEDANFVVVSDSEESKRLAEEMFPGRVFASSSVPFHTDKSAHDSLTGTLGSWVDMLLLALSDAIVLSRSGFGESAAEIGMFPPERVLRWEQCVEWV